MALFQGILTLMMTLTDNACNKLREILQKQGAPEGALRIKVFPGGCSGLSYQLDLVAAPEGDDKVFGQEGAKVVVDSKSLMYLENSTLDYAESLQSAGFKVINPNAKASCFCGESFAV